MSSPRKALAESEKDQKRDGSNSKDLISWKTLPFSGQRKTSESVTHEDFQHSDYEDLFKDATESESERSMWTASGSFLRDKWSSEDDELAGPSHTVSSRLHGIQIVSEWELAQLAQVRPLIFSFREQSAIKDCFKMLQKKVEYEIIQEFMDLEYKNPTGEFNSGNEPSNRDKNRYRDILPSSQPPVLEVCCDTEKGREKPLPSGLLLLLILNSRFYYDSTRVPLGENKDYINANYIRIINAGEEYFYIATQGPLPSTTDDFWQMVLENNANIIVMITREIEDRIIKCHHYWPISMKEPLELRNCLIFLENYQILQYFIIRIFQVVKKSTGSRHIVKQLQFTNWPDHGTPASVDGFIKFVRYVRKSHLTGPIIVHCSAGVGRTGVFLCVDVVFSAIEKNFSFNIKNIVAQMREQRYGMIQTKEQYCFCYKIVLEVLQKIVTFN
uniref:Protein tyrosine phosphatase non-receptor type 20 n=1 Tax=Rousettus aegyptiacus TaxID=9407 RepID=A0A7J8GEN7_ROUAE|nr:protein tyrosine phosphatase non-receptor type 20 [Rousettus aegyptiacus]